MKLNKSILALAVVGAFAGNAMAASELSVVDHTIDLTNTTVDRTQGATTDVTGKKINAEYRFFANDTLGVSYETSVNPGTTPGNDRAIVYTPAVALSQGTSLTMDFTKGGLKPDATMFLAIFDENALNNTGAWIQVATLSDFTESSGSDNTKFYSSVNFLIDTSNTKSVVTPGVGVGAGLYTATDGTTVSVGADGDPIPAGTLIQVFTDNGFFGTGAGVGSDGALPVVRVQAGEAKGTQVTAQITAAQDDAANPLNAPKTESATLVELVDGLNITLAVVADSTIDVENTNSRAGFVSEGGASDTPSVVESEANVTLSNTAEYSWSLGANDSFVMKVDRDAGDQGVTHVELGTDKTDFVASTTDSSWSLTSVLGGGAGSDLAVGAAVDLDIFINTTAKSSIDVTTPLVVSTGDWALDLSIDPSSETVDGVAIDIASFDVATDVTSHKWGINGMQAKAPYTYKINSAGWTSVYKFTNESTTGVAADVNMDIVVYDQTNGTSITPSGQEFTDVLLGTVASQGQATFTGADVVTAINDANPGTLDDANNYHFGITFTVVAPQNSVHLAVQNKSPDSRADAPVLYNINETCTTTGTGDAVVQGCKAGRVWQ